MKNALAHWLRKGAPVFLAGVLLVDIILVAILPTARLALG